MATITGLTAERMLEIEGLSVIDGEIRVDGHLWLIQRNGEDIDAGMVVGATGAPGPTGPTGPAGISAIPGEVRMWSGTTLPAIGTYGRWVWADGAVYAVASHPIAAGHINAAWRTAHGQSDPGGGNFRVPDLRGLTPAALDQMPGGARANRMTRAVAITIAAKTGEETHVVTVAEMPSHNHGGSVSISGSTSGVGDHTHVAHGTVVAGGAWPNGSGFTTADQATTPAGAHSHSFSGSGGIASNGGGGGHENVQPTVFVPYIVALDG
jgi:microcystin-dependent protein